jgi:hypothetical protein
VSDHPVYVGAADQEGAVAKSAQNADVRGVDDCVESCWKAEPCPSCGRSMNPRGRSAPLEMTCTTEPCPADDRRVNPRHLWDAGDSERWRFHDPHCELCGHARSCHSAHGEYCEVEVSDYGDLDCSCTGFAARPADLAVSASPLPESGSGV